MDKGTIFATGRVNALVISIISYLVLEFPCRAQCLQPKWEAALIEKQLRTFCSSVVLVKGNNKKVTARGPVPSLPRPPPPQMGPNW